MNEIEEIPYTVKFVSIISEANKDSIEKEQLQRDNKELARRLNYQSRQTSKYKRKVRNGEFY